MSNGGASLVRESAHAEGRAREEYAIIQSLYVKTKKAGAMLRPFPFVTSIDR